MIRLPYALLIMAYCALLFWLSSQSEPGGIEGPPGVDKLVHFAAYGILAGLVSIGLRFSSATVHPRIQFLGPVAFALIYGLFDETHQYFVPLRSFDPLDLLADFSGALFVSWVLARWWGISLGRQADL